MYQGGETALQADCGEFDSRGLHKVLVDIFPYTINIVKKNSTSRAVV